MGQNLSLHCLVQDVTLPLNVTWFKHHQVHGSWTNRADKTGIPYMVKLQASADQSPSILQLTNVTEADSGMYTCRIENQYGGDASSGWVKVSKIKSEAKNPNILLIVALVGASIAIVLLIGIAIRYFKKYK